MIYHDHELRSRVEALEAHIRRLDECIVALAAMADSPLGSLSCGRFIQTNSDGHPRAGTSIE
jgi:hypothetical protein